MSRLRLSSDSIVAVLLFAVALSIFLLAPVHGVTDSAYSLVASESLLHHRTFQLDNYAIPQNPPKHWVDYESNGELYTIELTNNHLYYFFPPGGVVLAVPFVAVFDVFGISAVNPDGTYNPENEETIEHTIAALLMAALAAVFFYTSRLALPRAWSIVIAIGGVFGTQIFSTASRVLWTDTWGTLLLGLALLMILRRAVGGKKLSGIVLATLLAWAYFVRPTYSVHIAAITIFVFLFQREYFIRYALTGAAWLLLFLGYSWHNFHHLLPSYYRASRLYFGVFWTSLAANTLSPGRGLLVYVPTLFFVGYLLIRYRRELPYARIVVMSLAVIVVHIAVMSCFGHWWGGYSFGPRFSTGLVPWFVVLAVLGARARTNSLEKNSRAAIAKKAELLAGALLLCASVAINGLGATDRDTELWNVRPGNIDLFPERVWDWRQPQFLAGFLKPPAPATFPLLTDRIEIARTESDSFLWYGWSPAEPEFRWTDGTEAAMVFRVTNPRDLVMTMKAVAFIFPGSPKQRVTLSLNGNMVSNFEITDDATHDYAIKLPAGKMQEQNVLTFDLPDATSPQSLSKSKDQRRLAVAIYSLTFTG